MRCVQAGNMCEKYSEYAQICANNERKYAEICGKYVHISGDMREKYAICLICCNMRENMRYAHLAKICGPEECAPHSRNRNCRNRECQNRNLYPSYYVRRPRTLVVGRPRKCDFDWLIWLIDWRLPHWKIKWNGTAWPHGISNLRWS